MRNRPLFCIAVVALEMVGGRMTFVVQVEPRRGGAHTVDAFKREIATFLEIQQCCYVTGEYDFILIVTARDMADYDALTRRIFFESPHIEKFHTTVTIESVKVGLAIPL